MKNKSKTPAPNKARLSGSGDAAELKTPQPSNSIRVGNKARSAAAIIKDAIAASAAESPLAPHQPRYGDQVSRYGQVNYVTTDPVELPPTDGARVKMDLSRRNNDNLGMFVGTHLTRMTGNLNFTDPSPLPAEMLAAYTAFQQKCASTSAAYAAYLDEVAGRDESRVFLETMMRRRAAYVQDTSNGNRQVILSSGLEVNNSPVPVGVLPPPTMLHAELNGTAGVIRLTWIPIARARGYLVQCSRDVTPRVWELEGSTGKARFEKQFVLGETYVFRVATQGTNGLSYWSPEIIRGAA